MCSAIQPSMRAEVGAEAQREAFFPEQHVAAVIGADRDDRVVLRKMGDEAALGIDVEHAVQAAWLKSPSVAELVPRDLAHARHDAHAQHDVDRVGHLDADLGQRRAGRPHEVGHDVHRAALHRAAAEAVKFLVHRGGRHPVVGRPGGVRRARADEGAFLDARDVVRVGAMIIAAGQLFLVELDQDARVDRLLRQPLLFLLAAVAPDRSGPGWHSCVHFLDPGADAIVESGDRGHGKAGVILTRARGHGNTKQKPAGPCGRAGFLRRRKD